MTGLKPHFPVLEAEISKAGFKKKDIAKAIGIEPRTLANKLKGKTEFNLTEVLEIGTMFPDIPPVELFSHKTETSTS